MSSYPYSYPFGESTDEFFAPLQTADAPSPESFDSEVDKDSEDLENLNWGDFISTSCDAVPTSTPVLTFSTTDSGFENAASQYSYDFLPSVNPSEIEIHGPSNDGISNTKESLYSAMFSNGLLSFPPAEPVKAQCDNGASNLPNFIEIPSGELPTVQPLVPAFLPVNPAKVEPFKPFICPHCPFASGRKHNLKTHIKTHIKEESDLFGCSICGRQLTRKHDLRRHYEKVHGERVVPSSVSSVSNCRFNPIPQIERDQKPMSSAPPDSSLCLTPAAGVPEDIFSTAWFKELEACFDGV